MEPIRYECHILKIAYYFHQKSIFILNNYQITEFCTFVENS